MKPDLPVPETEFVLSVLRDAATLAARVRSENAFGTHSKKDESPVTIADMGIQALAGFLIDRYFPGVPLVGEESAADLREPEGAARLQKITSQVGNFIAGASSENICDWIDRGTGTPGDSFWTLDPIDGTKGYLRGGQYVTALALIRGGRVEFSALGCPDLELPGHESLGKGVLIVASRGKGCWAAPLSGENQWQRLCVSGCGEISKARILDSYDPAHKHSEKNHLIQKQLGILIEPTALDSQAKHAVLAAGGAEIFYRTLPKKNPARREFIWDVAPGAFAIEEAGGRVTDLNGAPIDYSTGKILERSPGFVATNGLFHDSVLSAIREAVAVLSRS